MLANLPDITEVDPEGFDEGGPYFIIPRHSHVFWRT